MQKIIQGKRYDTEKSTIIGTFVPDASKATTTPSPFSPMMPGMMSVQIDTTQGERLHRGRYGSWFTHRDDGTVNPLQPEQARAWMESNNLTDEIPKHFSISEA